MQLYAVNFIPLLSSLYMFRAASVGYFIESWIIFQYYTAHINALRDQSVVFKSYNSTVHILYTVHCTLYSGLMPKSPPHLQCVCLTYKLINPR